MIFDTRYNDMFEKKKFADSTFSVEENVLLGRVEKCHLLKRLIDPSLPFGFPEEHAASKFELELCFLAVSGRLPERTASVGELMRQIAFAIECASRIHSFYKDQVYASGCKASTYSA